MTRLYLIEFEESSSATANAVSVEVEANSPDAAVNRALKQIDFKLHHLKGAFAKFRVEDKGEVGQDGKGTLTGTAY